MLKQLYPDDIAKRLHDERPATYLMADPVSGLAPNWVRVDRLGEVLLARADGELCQQGPTVLPLPSFATYLTEYVCIGHLRGDLYSSAVVDASLG